jgi:protein phosphatase
MCSGSAFQPCVNEDYAIADPDAGVFVVADGMGGRPSGHLASRIAADAFLDRMRSLSPRSRLQKTALSRAVASADAAVRRCGDRSLARRGMGSTLAAAVVRGCNGRIVHLGDSRVYLYRKGKIRCLTRDHTLVQELFRRHHIKKEDIKDHPLSHVLLRTVGAGASSAPDICEFEFQPGDGLILTTDEMPRILDEREMAAIARQNWDSEARVICEQLFGFAMARHPQDDLTVMVLKRLPTRGLASPQS